MNAPVIAPAPGGRSAAPRTSENGRAHSAAPFASALDGALSEGRATRAPDRGAPDRADLAERAAHRDAAKDQRAADRSDAAARRAADKTDRIEARADRAASRTTAEDGAGAAETPPRPVDGGTRTEDAAPLPAVAGEETTAEVAPATEPPRGGLPALWALVMGGSLASTPVVEAGSGDAGATTPPISVPSAPVAAALTAAPVPVASDASATVPATPVPATTVPAATATGAQGPVVATAAQVTSTAPAADGLPAGFTAVLADAIATPAGTSAAPGTTPAPVPATLATPAAPAAPAVPVDVALEATPATVPATVAGASSVPATGATASAEGTTAEGAGAAAADDVAAPAGPSGKALAADAGGAGQDGSADRAPAGTAATGSAVGPAAPVAASGPAAVADADGATGGAAALPVGTQVARQVSVLAAGPDGKHSMTLVLTPDTLGEVQVQVTLTKGAIELALRGAHEHGRAALLEALPELRRDLEAAGLNPSRLEVARETGGSLLDRQSAQQQGFGERGDQQDRGDNRSRPWGRPADTGGSGPSRNTNDSTSPGVDVLV